MRASRIESDWCNSNVRQNTKRQTINNYDKSIIKKLITRGTIYMKTLNGITFLETKDIKKALQIGNKTCLDLFNKKDFPGKKIGKSWLVMEEAFKDYFKFQQNTNI